MFETGIPAKWVILDGLVPVIVDAATGDWKELQTDVCNATTHSRRELGHQSNWPTTGSQRASTSQAGVSKTFFQVDRNGFTGSGNKLTR